MFCGNCYKVIPVGQNYLRHHDDYFTFRNAPIRNKENSNPHQGTHQSETRNAPIRTRNALAGGVTTE